MSIMADKFYDLVDRDMDGNEVKMSKFEGSLVEEYGARGFKVLAFPCNQFAGQEPGTHEEILKFVEKYGARETLTWFEKADVNGAKARGVFSFLKEKLPNPDGTKDVRWNFAKFLIDHEGKPYKRFTPKEDPSTLKDDIEFLLKKKESSD
eukprot:scaffold405648_cov55-Attheya_sp.AAC.2